MMNGTTTAAEIETERRVSTIVTREGDIAMLTHILDEVS
jgi:hypothetical protein